VALVDGYSVGSAYREHLGMLPEIERAAAALFPDEVLTPEIRRSTVPRLQLETALVEGGFGRLSRIQELSSALRSPCANPVQHSCRRSTCILRINAKD
jgi:hypothetical protein